MKLITALVLPIFLALVLGVSNVQAEEPPQSQEEPQLLVLQVLSVCGPAEEQEIELLEQYGERPFVTGKGLVRTRVGFTEADVTIFASPSTFTFSIVATFNDGISCILTSGSEMGPGKTRYVPGIKM